MGRGWRFGGKEVEVESMAAAEKGGGGEGKDGGEAGMRDA